jgi:Putative addiction module component
LITADATLVSIEADGMPAKNRRENGHLARAIDRATCGCFRGLCICANRLDRLVEKECLLYAQLMTIAQSIESIQQAALELQPADRAHLTHTLVQSLSSLPESEISELWLDEAERRDAEMESGLIVGIPGDEVFHRMQVRYSK